MSASATPRSTRSKVVRWPMEISHRFRSMATQAREAKPGEGKADGQPVHMDEVLVEIAGPTTMPEFTEHLREPTRAMSAPST